MQPRARSSTGRGPYLTKVALIAAAYYGSGKLGLELAFETSSVTAIWPPTGIALAALVLGGRRLWPGVALGALLANAWTGVPLLTVAGIALGNTLEALVGVWLLERAGFRPSLERVRDVLALAGLAGALSTAVSATIGVTSLIVGDEVVAGDFAAVWRTWWLGDLGGDLLVAPAVLALATHWRERRPPGSAPEAVVLATSLAALSAFVFSREMGLTYLVFPGLIWAALRFWQPGATLAGLLVAGIAVWFTQGDSGPFLRDSPDDSLLLAQTFAGVSGMTALLLATVTSQRARAEQEVEHIARTLEESLLPSRLPDIPSVEAAARFLPAGEPHRVGGDFYDVFAAGDSSWAVVVGDVCGKGAEAAAVTGIARHTIRAAAAHEGRPTAVLRLLNTAIRGQPESLELCSAAFVRLETDDGALARLVVSSAGHPLPLVLRADGSVDTIGRPGTLLGVADDPDLSDEQAALSAGDAVLLYTDGLLDAHAPGRAHRPADVAEVLRSCAGLSASEIVVRLESAMLHLEDGAPRDDIALLVLRRV